MNDLEIFQERYRTTRDLREATTHVPEAGRLMFLCDPATKELVRAIEKEFEMEEAEEANPTPANLIKKYGKMVDVLTDMAETEADVKAAQAAIAAIQWQLGKLAPEVYGEKKENTGANVAVQVNTGPVVIKTAEGEMKEVTFDVGNQS